MIRPTKYLDLNTSIIRISAVILSTLQEVHFLSLDELYDLVQIQISETARFNFIPALNLLFLTECIEYDIDSDIIIYEKHFKLGEEH